ncbi:MAG: PhnD/SsuA/transferrin family substrate-binding protein, partial [Gammaproteobacteria bacterium]|nr:PhnD/SsuA/transferrin family substrate-binding protein [Gammaproteobacteria bacterium]
MPDRKFISCGMYALTSELRLAWQALFAAFSQAYTHAKVEPMPIRFTPSMKLLRDPEMFIGQTCGYPLMHFLQPDIEPLCAASYQLPGCNGIYYSSQFIVPVNSDLHSLADCMGQTVAINSWDSNSGMNVLRYALAPIARGKTFFAAVRDTGSHYQSLVDVA